MTAREPINLTALREAAEDHTGYSIALDPLPIRHALLALVDAVEAARAHLQESAAGTDEAATTANRLAEALERFTP